MPKKIKIDCMVSDLANKEATISVYYSATINIL